jgi:hypothetical protein
MQKKPCGQAHVRLEYTMGWTMYDVRMGGLAHIVSKELQDGPLDYETSGPAQCKKS